MNRTVTLAAGALALGVLAGGASAQTTATRRRKDRRDRGPEDRPGVRDRQGEPRPRPEGPAGQAGRAREAPEGAPGHGAEDPGPGQVPVRGRHGEAPEGLSGQGARPEALPGRRPARAGRVPAQGARGAREADHARDQRGRARAGLRPRVQQVQLGPALRRRQVRRPDRRRHHEVQLDDRGSGCAGRGREARRPLRPSRAAPAAAPKK